MEQGTAEVKVKIGRIKPKPVARFGVSMTGQQTKVGWIGVCVMKPAKELGHQGPDQR